MRIANSKHQVLRNTSLTNPAGSAENSLLLALEHRSGWSCSSLPANLPALLTLNDSYPAPPIWLAAPSLDSFSGCPQATGFPVIEAFFMQLTLGLVPVGTARRFFFRRAALVAILTMAAPGAMAQDANQTPKVLSQAAEVMPSKAPGAAIAAPVQAPVNPKPAVAPWIWGADANKSYKLHTVFKGTGKSAVLVAACDNNAVLYVNGKEVGKTEDWQRPVSMDVTKHLKDGDNELAAVVKNEGGPAGFSCRLVINDAAGAVRVIQSDQSWESSDPANPATNTAKVKVVAKAGDPPYGNALAGEVASPAAESSFNVPEGFKVERLFSVPKNELGSWVSLTTDPKGRLIASDQEGKGLYRITPAPLDGSKPTIVEKVPAPITGAQGLLFAFDALYVVCNGGTGSGLYRVTDSDGNDTLDKVEKLRDFPGGGEHGPHNILLSPDGKKLFIIAGNHTKPPFEIKDVTEPQTMGGIRANQRRVELAKEGSSRVPANWDEDQMVARMWDANGHAAGILAPGGYIVSTDPMGKTWEIWSSGYRNPYDMGFNADGELFAYDADMEWDFGSPWYRPTRVNHATSGSELGWRSGSGKWAPSLPDSLPALVDIGPGSPVGATFGYGTKFPGKYQKAFFICDWTFGTMYAIHLTPEGATYKGTKEEFVSRTPLPLTDVTVGKEGALYFTVGGRGGQSELYRVTYTGAESTAPVNAHDVAGAEQRQIRHELEAFHSPQANPAAAVEKALPLLSSPDRFLRYAARVALEHQPISLWQDKALATKDAKGRITAAIAVAHQAEPSAQPAVLSALNGIDLTSLDAAGKIDLVRAYELALIRLGAPSSVVKSAIAARFAPLFPSGTFDLDRELSNLLVAVRAPGIVSKLVGLLAAPSSAAGATNLAPNEEELKQLITRNAGYGGDVKKSLEKRSDLLQVHFAYALRTVSEKDAWTLADRKAYHEWFNRSREWAGGNSFRKFLDNIEKESFAGLGEGDAQALQAILGIKPYQAPPLPKPKGPGREWSIEDVMAAADKSLAKGRDFTKGKEAFSAARCIVCHRYGDDGGATGPDLTQAGGRFQVKDLVEAIVMPSKVVSDQYRASVVQTTDGKTLTGRIVSENPKSLIVVTDPEDATKFVELERTKIEEIAASLESLMPRELLNQLSEEEVLDLLAFTLARGNAKDARFTK